MATLKIWNGRGQGKYTGTHHIYVAAYSSKQACEIIGIACELLHPMSASELSTYFSKGSWGNSMDDVIPTFPCVYVQKDFKSEPPIKLY